MYVYKNKVSLNASQKEVKKWRDDSAARMRQETLNTGRHAHSSGVECVSSSATCHLNDSKEKMPFKGTKQTVAFYSALS